MLSTNKDFEISPTNNHPTTYFCLSKDTKPVKNVINGAILIETVVDADPPETKVYSFDKENEVWREM